tara:strand:+ start:286 stop:822 length:537 start_codon:yes stop_codon:yes gene_type:complete
MKLHLGCWHRYIPGFVHVDLCELPHINFQSDIGNLSFAENNSVEYIYCSHSLEYKDYVEAEIVLKEWSRVLKPGGLIRIAVPDFDALIKLYNQTKTIDSIIGPLFGKMPLNEDVIYHKSVYNFEKLENLLINCGFNNVKKYDWRATEHAEIDDHSQAYYPHMDKDKGMLLSLNVECIK